MTAYRRCDGPFPFEANDGGESTTAALRRIHIARQSDLAHVRPYADAELVRVILRKVPVEGGHAIHAFAADDAWASPEPMRAAPPIGVVRPVQRSVMRAGLDRVAQLHEAVVKDLKDPWGYVRIESPTASEPVSITPPILEEVPREDRLAPDGELRGVLDWAQTAQNVRDEPPPQDEKYRVRDAHYRRYYRDVTTGFGSVGGQASAATAQPVTDAPPPAR